jgi:hypothetical protein
MALSDGDLFAPGNPVESPGEMGLRLEGANSFHAASPEGFLVTQTSVGSSRQRSQGGLVHLVNGCRGDAEFGGSRTIGSAGASPARAFW